MSNERNIFCFSGQIKFPPVRRTSASGNSFLPLTIEQSKSAIPVILFGVLADSLASVAQQGMNIIVKGRMNQRKGQDGYYNASLVVTEYSIDDDRTRVTEQSLQSQQHQAGVQQVQEQIYSAPVQQPMPPVTGPEFDDEIPF